MQKAEETLNFWWRHDLDMSDWGSKSEIKGQCHWRRKWNNRSVHILVKSGPIFKTKWSSIHSSHIIKYISPANMWHFWTSNCLSITCFIYSKFEHLRKFLFKMEVAPDTSKWWRHFKVKVTKQKCKNCSLVHIVVVNGWICDKPTRYVSQPILYILLNTWFFTV